ncbi:MAG TPA: cytochrome c oxidase subunit 3 [Verrucomicrobiae bacterium]|jgi:cytochrome c oxidase subunit 3
MEIPYAVKPRPDTGLYNAKVGIWLFLASEVMLFGALFCSYILLRVNAPEGMWPHHWLNIWLGMTNTIVLIFSSVTVVLGWASLKMGQFKKYKFYQAITMICAVAFLCIKSYEYHDKFIHYQINLKDGGIVDGHLVKSETTKDVVVVEGRRIKDIKELYNPPLDHEGEIIKIPRADIKIDPATREPMMENYGPWHNTYTGIYFTLTGLHALHVIAGCIVIFFIWGPLAKVWEKDPERYINRVEVSGLFWHFVDLVWIFLFPVLYLL